MKMPFPVVSIVLTWVSFALADLSPMIYWDFDGGKNLDTETGMAEFSRARAPSFPGLMSQGSNSVQLQADVQVDASRAFASSLRGMAMRCGVDEATGSVFAGFCQLPVALSAQEGSIAFWLKAEDWDGSQQGRNRVFIAASAGTEQNAHQLLLFKNASNNNLMFRIDGQHSEKRSVVEHSIWNWKRGEWHFVCIAWTPSELTLHMDGHTAQCPRFPTSCPLDYHLLRIGTCGWKNEGGLTLLDDVAIFPHALSRKDMETWRVKTRPVTNDRKAPMTHRIGLSTPKLDARLSPFEYGVTFNSTFSVHSGELSNVCQWSFARDKENLYFAFDTPCPTRAPSHNTHDSNLWEDESVEIHLDANGHQWQFIINANSAVYDSLDGRPAWNAPGLRVAQHQENSRWIVEALLPFADLNIVPAEGMALYMTLGRSATNVTNGSVAASPLLRQFADRVNFIKVIFDQNAPPVELLFETLPSSDGTLDLTAKLPENHECQLHLLCHDVKERKLHEDTVESKTAEHCTQARIHAAGLAREGACVYDLVEKGICLAQAKFRYATSEKLKVRYILVHAAKQTLETMLAINPPFPTNLTIRQMLKDHGGKLILRQDSRLNSEQAAKYNITLHWGLSALPPGEYDYYLAIVENGQEKIQHHQLFLKPMEKMPWDDFQAGIDTIPPAPWHTPKHAGTTLQCLTQSYDFGGLLLPSQITAQGKVLLDSPIVLRLNGKELSLPSKLEITGSTPLETRFRTRAQADGVSFEVNGILEYDGWLRLSLTYNTASGQPAMVNDLALELPMSQPASKLVFSFRPADSRLPAGRLDKSHVYDLMEHPVFWLGNADYGLFWGADSMRGTHLAHPEASLQLTPTVGEKGARAIILLVDSRLTLTEPRTITFGLQGTPVKPLHRRPSPYMWRGGDTCTEVGKFFRIFNYYNPAYIDQAEARRLVENARKRTPIYCFYACIYGISPFCPEWPWYCEEWISSPPGPGQFKQDFPTNDESARNLGLWGFACVANPSFLNWQLYNMNHIIQDKDVGLRDMYFDMGYPRVCDNLLHGCGWHDDFGKLRKTYPITANREFTKRIRKILRDKNQESVLVYHPSGEPLPPIYGLVDFVIDGEIYVADIARSENYFDIFTPELMQSAFTGIRAGINAVYVSQLNRAAMMLNPARSEYWRRKVKAPKALRAVRHFLGYCLLHDIHPKAGACIYNEGELLERQLYSLGYDKGNFTFHPYWREDRPVTCRGKIQISSYVFPDGKTLAVLVNDNKDETVQATLSIANQAHRIYDLETGRDTITTITIAPKDFRLIVFEQ